MQEYMLFLHAFLSDRCFPVRSYSMPNQINCTFSFMVLFTKDNAIPENIDKLPAYLSANSLHNFYKFEKGESKTKQAISWFWSAYIKAVTAPILLPQIAILETVSKDRKYVNTQSTSSL